MSLKHATEFLAYLVVSDRLIHSAELGEVAAYLDANRADAAVRQAVRSILADSDEKTPYAQVVRALGEWDIDQQRALLDAALRVACADCHYDSAENQALAPLFDLCGVAPSRRDQLVDSVMTQALANKLVRESIDRTVSQAARYRIRLLVSLSPLSRRAFLRQRLRRLELTGPKYRSAIMQGAQVAQEDADLIVERTETIRCRGQEVLEDCKRLMSGTSLGKSAEADEVRAMNQEFFSFLKDSFSMHLESIEALVNKKRRSSHFFTVAFLGRTKAGKSTVHSLLTDQGREFVGDGSQRTTRFTRVYEWDNLRIIDTPGIGAGDEGGRTDEEIALDIVDEADLLCYLVSNDNIQETEFQLLRAIRDMNKPVLILLNVKSNLGQSFRYRRFLESPLEWYTTTGSDRIQGHLDRIQRQVDEFGGGRAEVMPLHLLAARQSTESSRPIRERRLLLEGSRIGELYDFLHNAILQQGSVRRAKNLVDGTRTHLESVSRALREQANDAKEKEDKLRDRKSALIDKGRLAQARVRNQLTKDYSNLFGEWRNAASEFAEQHYHEAKDTVARNWQNHLNSRLRSSSHINEIARNAVTTATDDLKQYLEDMSEDFAIFERTGPGLEYKQRGTFNTKRAVSVSSLLAGIVGTVILFFEASNPIGWAFAIGSAVIGLLANVFKSKEQKRTEAVTALRTSLLNSLTQYHEQVGKEVLPQVQKQLDDLLDRAVTTLDQIVKLSLETRSLALKLEDSCVEAMSALDRRYAQRLWSVVSSDQTQLVEISRNLNSELELVVRGGVPDGTSERLSDILQERVHFVPER